jgi:hypothetical protein
LQAALESLLACDAVLLSDAGGAHPGCGQHLGVQHEMVDVPASQRVRSSYHSQTANNWHQRWREFRQPFPGVATKCLDSELRWIQQAGLVREAALRSLAASMTPKFIRFAK